MIIKNIIDRIIKTNNSSYKREKEKDRSMNGHRSSGQRAPKIDNIQTQPTNIQQQSSESSDELGKVLVQSYRKPQAQDITQAIETTEGKIQKSKDASRPNLDRTSSESEGEGNRIDIETGSTNRSGSVSNASTPHDSNYSRQLKKVGNSVWNAAQRTEHFIFDNKIVPYEFGTLLKASSVFTAPLSVTAATSLGGASFITDMLYSIQKNRETSRKIAALIDKINHLAQELEIKKLSIHQSKTSLPTVLGINGAGILLQITFIVFSAIVSEVYKDREDETVPTILIWLGIAAGATGILITAKVHMYEARQLKNEYVKWQEFSKVLKECKTLLKDITLIPELKSPIKKIDSTIIKLDEFNKDKIEKSMNDIVKKNLLPLSNWVNSKIEYLNAQKSTLSSLDRKDASVSESDEQKEDTGAGVGLAYDADEDSDNWSLRARSAKQTGKDVLVSIKGKEKQSYVSDIEEEQEQEASFERSRNSLSLSKIALGVVKPEQFKQSEHPGKTPDSDIPANIIEESLLLAPAEEKIGPRQLQGWRLRDVEDKGNCFYDAVADQMQLLEHPFLKEVPEGTLPRDSLRLRVQGEKFKDKEWADEEAIYTLVKQFHLILAVVDTRSPAGGFTCYHEGEDGKIVVNRGEIPLPEGMNIMKLAHTGNHFLSVLGHPQLERGAIKESYSADGREESLKQEANVWQKEIQDNYRDDLEGLEDKEKQISSERQSDDLFFTELSDIEVELDEDEDKAETTEIKEEEKIATTTRDSLTFASNVGTDSSNTNKDNTSDETLTNQGV